jgi:hypothetical protein
VAGAILTDRELVAHARALASDPRFKPDFRQVVRFVDVTDMKVTSSGVR